MDLILAQEQVLRFVPPFAPWEGQLGWVQGRRLADTRAPSGTHRAVPFFPLLLQGCTLSAPSLRPHRSVTEQQQRGRERLRRVVLIEPPPAQRPRAAGGAAALDVQGKAGGRGLLLLGCGQERLVARGRCQGRVILPVAQVGERQADP